MSNSDSPSRETVKQRYDKLVRDRIPEIIRANDEHPITHVATGEEYERRLADKLCEEAVEFRESGEIEELADLLEVVAAIRENEAVSRDELATIRREKRADRGGFSDGTVLEAVETTESLSER